MKTFLLREMFNTVSEVKSLLLLKVKTTTYEIENIQCRGHHLWSSLPRETKDSNTLAEFKRKIKSLHGENCMLNLQNMG